MKWLGAEPATGDSETPSTGMLGNGHAVSPQMLRHPQTGSDAPGRLQVRGSQDDSYVGYVFQRAQTDPDFPQYPANKQPTRWALGDDTFIDNHHLGHDRWKVPAGKMPLQPPMMVPGQMPPPGVTHYDMHQAAMLKHQELAYLSAMSAAHPQMVTPVPVRNGQIATSAKKLWGVEEHQKDDKDGSGGGGILQHLGDHHQVWRDSTWSTSDHAVSQPISMAPRRSGSFPGSDAASILSPRSSETGGLGVKMVEYVLSSSPTNKELEPRLRVLGLNGPEGKKEGNEKAPSPFEGGNGSGQKDGEVPVSAQNGQQNSGQNGIVGDDDKGFNRTPGSRQPSPAEEQMSGVVKQSGIKSEEQQSQMQPCNPVANHAPTSVVVVPVPSNAAVVAQGQVPMHHPLHHPGMHPPPTMHQHPHHMQQQQLTGLDGGFDPHGMLTDLNPNGTANQQQQLYATDQGSGVQTQGGYGMIAPPQQQQPMDSPGVMPAFDIQALFRNQQQTAPQQLQLLQQQQFLASQQQQQQLAGLAAPAAFTNGAYLINAQEPYVGTLIPGPTVLPQYYGMAPWPVYPAGLLQPGAAAAAAAAAQQQQQQQPQQRRPLTPSGGSDISNSSGSLTQVPGQYQVIPAYYHENGIVMGNVRGLSSATPLRLVSPAPVLVNPGSAGNGVRLLNSQPQPIQTPPASLYSAAQPASLYSSTSGSGTPIGGSATLAGVGFSTLGMTQQSQQQQQNQQSQQPQQQTLAAVAASYGNSSLGTIGSPAVLGPLSTGLGLGSSSTGRRDSFDRNTSAFSPSLEYGRGKWPQSYGALGTVTASPSPLGLTGGSLTPPPSVTSLGGASSALGALMNSSRVLSAAPGAEAAKYRSGALGTLHNGHVFGCSVGNGLTSSGATSPGGGLGMSAQSLFAKLGQAAAVAAGTATATNGLDNKPPGRSRLLEDFRNNRFPNLQLRDLTNHIVEFSQDQHGSRFIQQKLERASVNEKQLVFTEILAHSYALMTDVFGNYVIQKFFEFGTPDQKATLAQKVRGHVLPLALQMYGCRVIQKSLESISAEQQHEIVRELDGHVLKCVKDQNGNHVVQKCIECVDPHALQFIINAFQGQVYALSTHPYGCRVIQRILEHCTQEQTQPILDELHSHVEQLIQDQYGNYVIQHVLEHGKPEDKSQIISSVRGKALVLSQHKFASNVVEKCVTHASRQERSLLIDEICNYCESGNSSSSSSALQTMMKDQYANYVVQKMIDVAEPGQRKILMHKIRPHLSSLRKYTYGKHIIAKLEKYFMKNNSTDLGPIGPPVVNSVAM